MIIRNKRGIQNFNRALANDKKAINGRPGKVGIQDPIEV